MESHYQVAIHAQGFTKIVKWWETLTTTHMLFYILLVTFKTACNISALPGDPSLFIRPFCKDRLVYRLIVRYGIDDRGKMLPQKKDSSNWRVPDHGSLGDSLIGI
jgi:hypothetical protein